jgi:branched-chain amino acid transport system substrate-binding protein
VTALASLGLSRRALLSGAALALATTGVGPIRVRAQSRPVRIGVIHPVTGPLGEVGLGCRLAAQLAVDAVNEAGGIASLGGARLEMLVGDSAGSGGARAAALRVIDAGARVLTGAFHSGHTAAVAAVAIERRLPFLVDTAIADAAMPAGRDAARGSPLVFRNFPTTSAFARWALQYVVDVCADAQRSISRALLMHTTDPLGTTQARRLEAAYAALRPSFEMLEFVPVSVRASSVAAELARVRSAAPDVLFLAVRPALVRPLFRELTRDALPSALIVSLGTPHLADVARAQGVTAAVERTLEVALWPNARNARTQRVAEEFTKRSGGRPLDATAGYAHEAVLLAADAIQRAGTLEPEAIATALHHTNVPAPVMVAAGPGEFDAQGENPNAAPALVQIVSGRPIVVWPPDAAERPYTL